MKLHNGTDRRGLVHSPTTTNAARADIEQMPDLLHREERGIFGDQPLARERPAGLPSARCPLPGQAATQWIDTAFRAINRMRSRTRAPGAHRFHVEKRPWCEAPRFDLTLEVLAAWFTVRRC